MSFAFPPLSFARVVAAWPDSLPLLALAGSGRYAVVPLRFSEVAFTSVAATPLAARPAGGGDAALPFRSGLIGLLSYDQLAPFPAPSAAVPRIFQVDAALIYDRMDGRFHRTERAGKRRPAAYEVPASVVTRLIDAPPPLPPLGPRALTLSAERPAEQYLALVRQALEDIRSGRYYQINLLRYFRAHGIPDEHPLAWLAHRLDHFGGPYAVLFSLPGLTVASFSPERFVRLSPDAHGLQAEARPIKGTAPRASDPAADRAAAEGLARSVKDRAELNMIVDLLRNDLNRVAVRGSVRVPDPGSLVSVRTVHHLEAGVTARLRSGLRLEELLQAVCPGGSITGAPKLEVMEAIRTYEGRPRGYFMGHAFYLDDSGAFDSSILIRTLVQEGHQAYAFAAGGGIVTLSEPESERDEIDAKTRVVTAEL